MRKRRSIKKGKLRDHEGDRTFQSAILDLTIGGMGGKETTRQLRGTEKELVVFISSGYAKDAVPENLTAYRFTDRIGKPFMQAELAHLFKHHFGGKADEN